jgi:ankyrin repeat protein
LFQAVKSGGILALRQLLEEEALDINSYDPITGSNALHAACEIAHKDMVVFLVDKGCDINHKNKNGMTPLHISCSKRYNSDSVVLTE